MQLKLADTACEVNEGGWFDQQDPRTPPQRSPPALVLSAALLLVAGCSAAARARPCTPFLRLSAAAAASTLALLLAPDGDAPLALTALNDVLADLHAAAGGVPLIGGSAPLVVIDCFQGCDRLAFRAALAAAAATLLLWLPEGAAGAGAAGVGALAAAALGIEVVEAVVLAALLLGLSALTGAAVLRS